MAALPAVLEESLTPFRDAASTRLDNGLRVLVAPNRQAPIVATCLVYRAGARHEPSELAGAAHFLEHMMFKGSERFPPGAVDRLTQELGGSNNAFTSHDATAYYFSLASEHWTQALDVEADRMAGLLLEAEEVERERQVIREEIAMYEDDPWDALELAVEQALFGGHPYGRPILGSRETLAAVGAAELAALHRGWYRPANAVLAVAGDIGPEAALAAVVERFAGVRSEGAGVAAPPAPPPARAARRIERRKGETARLFLALPAPPATTAEAAPLHLLLTVLAGGRTSRLHRELVDEDQLAISVSSELGERVEPGLAGISAELAAGGRPEEVEDRVVAALAALARRPPGRREVARARRILTADWVFGLERVHQQALALAEAEALFDREQPRRYFERLLAVPREELPRIAAEWLDPERGVIGWSRAADAP